MTRLPSQVYRLGMEQGILSKTGMEYRGTRDALLRVKGYHRPETPYCGAS